MSRFFFFDLYWSVNKRITKINDVEKFNLTHVKYIWTYEYTTDRKEGQYLNKWRIIVFVNVVGSLNKT